MLLPATGQPVWWRGGDRTARLAASMHIPHQQKLCRRNEAPNHGKGRLRMEHAPRARCHLARRWQSKARSVDRSVRARLARGGLALPRRTTGSCRTRRGRAERRRTCWGSYAAYVTVETRPLNTSGCPGIVMDDSGDPLVQNDQAARVFSWLVSGWRQGAGARWGAAGTWPMALASDHVEAAGLHMILCAQEPGN